MKRWTEILQSECQGDHPENWLAMMSADQSSSVNALAETHVNVLMHTLIEIIWRTFSAPKKLKIKSYKKQWINRSAMNEVFCTSTNREKI